MTTPRVTSPDGMQMCGRRASTRRHWQPIGGWRAPCGLHAYPAERHSWLTVVRLETLPECRRCAAALTELEDTR